MSEGTIILTRTDKTYKAGFCIIKENLSGLKNFIYLLHPKEIEYLDQLKFDKRKASYMLGRVAAKKAVSHLTEDADSQSIHIDFGVFKFPVVKSALLANIQVSISHCDEIGIALAFPEDHPLAVDIEKIDEDKLDTFRSQLTVEEQGLISNCDLTPLSGCATIWTIKEALSKILKTGFMIDFKILEIKSLEKYGDAYLSEFMYCAQYKGISYIHGDYVCSIILPGNTTVDLDDLWQAFKDTTE